MRSARFWTAVQRKVVISYRRFGTTYQSHLLWSRIQKERCLLNYGVYIGKSVGSDKFSVVWCQPLGLVGVVEREGECSSQCSFEERHFMWEEILTHKV